MTKAELIENIKNTTKRIKKANTRFARMTDAQKRIAIAKDVIKQVNAKRIKPTRGIYLETKFAGSKITIADVGLEMELKALYENMPSCNACALGSMFVCAVSKFNNLSIEEHINDGRKIEYDKNVYDTIKVQEIYYGRPTEYLGQFFSTAQLDELERAFEADKSWDPRSSTERLIAIMKNIIRNKGTFDAAQNDEERSDA